MEEFLQRVQNDPAFKEQAFERLMLSFTIDRLKKSENFDSENSVELLVDLSMKDIFKNGKFMVSMYFDTIKSFEPNPKIENWFAFFRSKFFEHFKNLSDVTENILNIIAHFFIGDMCDEFMIHHILKNVLIRNKNKLPRSRFLNAIKTKVKGVIYEKENLEFALKQGTVSREMNEIYEIIKRECVG